MAGKKVGVFGLGDQSSYGENYADATGELHDVIQGLEANLDGTYTEIDSSCIHEESKAIRDGKFCGLLCDQVNQDELTDGRVEKWVNQLEGLRFFGGGGGGGGCATAMIIDVVPEPAPVPAPSQPAAALVAPKSK
jgi:flavodoxin I